MTSARDAGEAHRFWRISRAGIFFQGGAAAVDTTTIVATLVHGLTGSTLAVGAAAALQRYGWLFRGIYRYHRVACLLRCLVLEVLRQHPSGY